MTNLEIVEILETIKEDFKKITIAEILTEKGYCRISNLAFLFNNCIQILKENCEKK